MNFVTALITDQVFNNVEINSILLLTVEKDAKQAIRFVYSTHLQSIHSERFHESC